MTPNDYTHLARSAQAAENAATHHVVVFGSHLNAANGRAKCARALRLVRKLGQRGRARWLRRHWQFITGSLPVKE